MRCTFEQAGTAALHHARPENLLVDKFCGLMMVCRGPRPPHGWSQLDEGERPLSVVFFVDLKREAPLPALVKANGYSRGTKWARRIPSG